MSLGVSSRASLKNSADDSRSLIDIRTENLNVFWNNDPANS